MPKRIGEYTYKDEKYGSLGDCKIKASNGKWVAGVAYCKDNLIYVRTVADFDSKFIKIPHDIPPRGKRLPNRDGI